MKKLITAILAVAMLCTMSLTAFAANPITTGNGTDTKDVKASYSDRTSATVYSVAITWGAMEFTYSSASDGVWDPDTRTYSDVKTAEWTSTTNSITVTNSSNAAVTATLAFAAEIGYTGIAGSFAENSGTANDGILELPTAVGTAGGTAPSATATLKLSGDLAATTAANTTIGTVTVTLS